MPGCCRGVTPTSACKKISRPVVWSPESAMALCVMILDDNMKGFCPISSISGHRTAECNGQAKPTRGFQNPAFSVTVLSHAACMAPDNILCHPFPGSIGAEGFRGSPSYHHARFL